MSSAKVVLPRIARIQQMARIKDFFNFNQLFVAWATPRRASVN